MAEDSTASRKYICYQPLLLILKMSRMFGIAPLTFGSDSIKFSRAYYIYSLIFIAALKATIFVGFVLDVTNPDQSLRARTSTSRIIWLAYLIVLTAVTVVGCCESPTRCKCMLNALHRIEEIKDLMGGVKSTPSDLMCIYATIFMFLSVVIVLSLIDLQQNLQAAYMLNKEEKGNKRVHTINNYMIQTKVTKPHSGYTVKKDFVSEEECRNEIRRLALVYELVCEVVRNVDRGHGLILLLLLQSFFLHFIMTPYYMINLYRVPDFFASIGQQIAWFHFHASNVILIVEPCHRVQQEVLRFILPS
ncbi:unnamed protein product [Leptosia nina]|uniref:Gustatory receptor n=1 Tax=Leptosia nina TaxID=320188 RepID=A0AAV1IW00_9NEOP